MISFISKVAAAAVFLGTGIGSVQAADVSEIRIDWATYHSVNLLLRKVGLEFFSAGSIDFGSTAGAAAPIARVDGNPIKSIYVYSRPEWTSAFSDRKAARSIPGPHVATIRDKSGSWGTLSSVRL